MAPYDVPRFFFLILIPIKIDQRLDIKRLRLGNSVQFPPQRDVLLARRQRRSLDRWFSLSLRPALQCLICVLAHGFYFSFPLNERQTET